MKRENKCKRKGKKVLLALKEKNLAKSLEENDKNLIWTLDRLKRKRTFLKKFESDLQVKNKGFKKTLYTIFDRSKIRFDRSKITFD